MDLKINYHDREISYFFGDKSGSSIDGLLQDVRGAKIKAIYLEGESPSYTFTRQIYLLVNLLRKVSAANLFLNGQFQEENQPLLPSYRE
jgi:hypothetical protein